MIRPISLLVLPVCCSLAVADESSAVVEQGGLWSLITEYFLYIFFEVLIFLLHSYYALRTRFLNAELQSEIEQKNKLLKKLQQMATMDELTGLPNRKLTFQMFHRELVRSQRTGSKLALLFIDLDDFKEVNEHLGHSQGDEILVKLGRIFSQLIRGNDLAGRIGGDKFLIVLGDINSAEDARLVVKKLHGSVDSIAINRGEQVVSANISVIVFVADETSTIEGLLSTADDILKQSKQDGRGEYRLVDMTNAPVVLDEHQA